jgi:hypothetical protein
MASARAQAGGTGSTVTLRVVLQAVSTEQVVQKLRIVFRMGHSIVRMEIKSTRLSVRCQVTGYFACLRPDLVLLSIWPGNARLFFFR